MVEVWRRGWGRRPALTRSAPPPHAASRGGIDATQMAPEPEIQGRECGKSDAQQHERLLGTGLCLMDGLAGGARPVATQARRARYPRIGLDRLLGERRQGYGVGPVVAGAERECDGPEQNECQ